MTADKRQREDQRKKRSSILKGFYKLSEYISKKAKNGLFGKIFGSYTKVNDKMHEGIAASLFGKNSKISGFMRKLRLLISEQFEGSKIIKLITHLSRFFLGCKIRLYSAFFMTFGIYTGLVYFLKKFVLLKPDVSASLLNFALIVFIISIPLLFTKKSLAEALITSKTGYFIVSDIFGISDEKLNIVTTKHGRAYNLAILAGVVFGSLTYFINPVYIVPVIIIFSVIALIVTFPEIGVIISVSLLPLMSVKKHETLLITIIALYVLGYVIKFIRGKRVLSFEITDLVLLFFVILMLAKGAQKTEAANFAKTLCLFVGAFVAGKLVRIKVWQTRCLLAAAFSGTVVALMTVWQKIAEFSGGFAGYSFFIFERNTIPFFDGNIQILSAFLTVCLLLNFGLSYSAKGTKPKWVLALNCIILIASLILLGSVFEAVCGLLALLVFSFIMSHNTLSAVTIISTTAIAGSLIVPQDIKSRIVSFIFKDTVASFISIVKVWDGGIELLKSTFFTGVGIGGFSKLYPIYSFAGAENVSDCGSLWIRIFCELGIIGIAVFVLILFLFSQNCIEYLRKPLGTKSKAMVAAGLSCVIFLVLASAICDIFSNNCMYYIFWMLITVTCAAIKNDRREIQKNTGYSINSEIAASVNL